MTEQTLQQPEGPKADNAAPSAVTTWAEARALADTREGLAQLRAKAKERAQAVVAAAVHDQLIPQAYRGPDVDFAIKSKELQQRIQIWTEQLSKSGEQVLEKLSRKISRCIPYGGATAPLGQPNPSGCNSRICPNCYARRIHHHYNILRMTKAPYLALVGRHDRLSTSTLMTLKFSLGFAHRQLKAALRKHVPMALIRTTLGRADPSATVHPFFVSIFGIVPFFSIDEAELTTTLNALDVGLETYSATDASYVQVMGRMSSYCGWLMKESNFDRLPLFLAAVHGQQEFSWFDSCRRSLTEPSVVALGGPEPAPSALFQTPA